MGGLIGCHQTLDTLSTSYYAGTVSYSTPSKTGPIVGFRTGSPRGSGNFWDADTLSGLVAAWPTPAPSPFGSGLPTATLQNGTPYAGWDTSKWSFAANSYPLHINIPGISQPTQLAATSAAASIALSWSAPTQNFTGSYVSYSIYRGTQAGSETLIKSGVTNTTWVDSAANNPSSPPAGGQLYYYRVRAEGNGIPSGYSTRVSATPL